MNACNPLEHAYFTAHIYILHSDSYYGLGILRWFDTRKIICPYNTTLLPYWSAAIIDILLLTAAALYYFARKL